MERRFRWLVAAAAVGVVMGAGVTYVTPSRDAEPDVAAMPDPSLWEDPHDVGRAPSPGADEKIASLSQRVDADPSNLGNWIEIARSYRAAGRYQEAADAFRRTWEIAGDQPIVLSAYGEALVLAAGGTVTPEARRFLEAAVRGDPGDIKARHYLALAEERAGNKEGALGMWVEILRNAPAGASWASAVRERIAKNAEALGRDVTVLLPENKSPEAPPEDKQTARGPTAGDVAASANMSTEDRQAMIEGMVARLAARLEGTPNDVDGWMRLSKSYTVLRQFDRAEYASSRAASIAPENPDVLLTYARAVRAAAGDKATPQYREVLQKLLDVEPNNAEALWRLGVAAAISGDTDKGIAMLERALANTPNDSPEHATIQKHISAMRLSQREGSSTR